MSRSVRATLASVALIGASALLGGAFGGKAQAAADTRDVHLKRYSEILSAIETNYVEEVDVAKPVASSIREMLRTLDPHSSFFEVKEYSNLQERQKGSYFGLGITIVSIEGRITVVSPLYPPAASSRLANSVQTATWASPLSPEAFWFLASTATKPTTGGIWKSSGS